MKSLFLFQLLLDAVLPQELTPEVIMQYGGLALLLAVVFAETGIFFCFFFPGDSLLFAAGLFCQQSKYFNINFSLLLLLLVVAAALGTTVGYLFGRWTGNYFSKRKENFFYRKRYVDVTEDFFVKYGMMAFVLGRFIPIVRTFLPIMAGVAKVNMRTFFIYNLLGAVVWVVSITSVGYFLSKRFPQLGEHLGLVSVILIVISTTPIIIQIIRKRWQARQAKKE